MKPTTLTLAASITVAIGALTQGPDRLEQGFKSPPDSAKAAFTFHVFALPPCHIP